MGIGPVPAVKKAMERAGLKVSDMDVIGSNEAFAAQVCSGEAISVSIRQLNPQRRRCRVGHPIGATGAILTVKTIYELHRTGGRYGLVTVCRRRPGDSGDLRSCSTVAQRVLTLASPGSLSEGEAALRAIGQIARFSVGRAMQGSSPGLVLPSACANRISCRLALTSCSGACPEPAFVHHQNSPKDLPNLV